MEEDIHEPLVSWRLKFPSCLFQGIRLDTIRKRGTSNLLKILLEGVTCLSVGLFLEDNFQPSVYYALPDSVRIRVTRLPYDAMRTFGEMLFRLRPEFDFLFFVLAAFCQDQALGCFAGTPAYGGKGLDAAAQRIRFDLVGLQPLAVKSLQIVRVFHPVGERYGKIDSIVPHECRFTGFEFDIGEPRHFKGEIIHRIIGRFPHVIATPVFRLAAFKCGNRDISSRLGVEEKLLVAGPVIRGQEHTIARVRVVLPIQFIEVDRMGGRRKHDSFHLDRYPNN
jgi:hypothetical protein